MSLQSNTNSVIFLIIVSLTLEVFSFGTFEQAVLSYDELYDTAKYMGDMVMSGSSWRVKFGDKSYDEEDFNDYDEEYDIEGDFHSDERQESKGKTNFGKYRKYGGSDRKIQGKERENEFGGGDEYVSSKGSTEGGDKLSKKHGGYGNRASDWSHENMFDDGLKTIGFRKITHKIESDEIISTHDDSDNGKYDKFEEDDQYYHKFKKNDYDKLLETKKNHLVKDKVEELVKTGDQSSKQHEVDLKKTVGQVKKEQDSDHNQVKDWSSRIGQRENHRAKHNRHDQKHKDKTSSASHNSHDQKHKDRTSSASHNSHDQKHKDRTSSASRNSHDQKHKDKTSSASHNSNDQKRKDRTSSTSHNHKHKDKSSSASHNSHDQKHKDRSSSASHNRNDQKDKDRTSSATGPNVVFRKSVKTVETTSEKENWRQPKRQETHDLGYSVAGPKIVRKVVRVFRPKNVQDIILRDVVPSATDLNSSALALSSVLENVEQSVHHDAVAVESAEEPNFFGFSNGFQSFVNSLEAFGTA